MAGDVCPGDERPESVQVPREGNPARVYDDEVRRAPDFEIDADEFWQAGITDAGQVRLQNVEPRT